MTIKTEYVLLPLLLCVFGGVLFGWLKGWEKVTRLPALLFGTEGKTISELEWRQDLVLHGSFYGSAIAALLGVAHDSIVSKVVAGVWFVLGLWYSRRLNARITEMEEAEQRVHWNKLAGMIRSVVKSELKSASAQEFS